MSILTTIMEMKEVKEKLSPLGKLSEDYEFKPGDNLNGSLDKVCSINEGRSIIPRKGGDWDETPGDSTFKPYRDTIPSNRNYSNMNGKTWGEILDNYGIEGIPFKDGEPDFSEVTKGTVEIDDFSTKRYGIGGNFDQADNKMAIQHGCSIEEVQKWRMDNNFTWHEMSDCRTMQKVPREIHNNLNHSGGISVATNKYQE